MRCVILGVQCGLQARKAGETAAVAAVTGRGIFLEDGATGKTAGKFSGVEIGEEIAMPRAGKTGNCRARLPR